MTYHRNVPGWEQILRILAGVGIAAYAVLAFRGTLPAYALIAAGAIVMLTGMAGWCPMCAIGGRNLKGGQDVRT